MISEGLAFVISRTTSCLLAGAIGLISVQSASAEEPAEPVAIYRIAFLIHPFCYRVPRPEGYDSSPETRLRWDQYVSYENRIAERWLEGIADLGPHEVLVICAGRLGCPPDLRAYAQKHLGHRAVVIEEYLDQRWDFSIDLSAQTKISIADELVAMYQRYGHDWSAQSLALPIATRGWVEHLHQEFKQRGLTFDPATVRVDAWGESFEGCVASYARYLGPYLGLARPIENDFQMTVPDAPFLLSAKFIDKIPLKRDVRLYFWELADGRLVAIFQKASATVSEPALFAQFPLDGLQVEIRDKSGLQIWPDKHPHPQGSVEEQIAQYNEGRSRKLADWEKKRRETDSTSVLVGNELRVPLAGWPDAASSYIFVRGSTPAVLRAILANAKLVEDSASR